MVKRFAVVLALVALIVFGVKLIQQSHEQIECNYGVQSLDVSGKTVYWRVVRGQCTKNDVNFDTVAKEIALDLENADATAELADAKCKTSVNRDLYAFGKDYYSVNDLDCANPVFRMHEDQLAQKEAIIQRNLRRQAEKEALKRKVAERERDL